MSAPDRSAPSRGELLLLALVVASAAAYWTWFRVRTGIVLEDALITFRFAENLATGNGFAFNPGEPVLGTTTPLLTLLLAGLGALLGAEHVPLCANVLLIGTGAAALVCFYLAARRAGLPAPPALLGVVLVAFHPSVVWSTAGGMETPLVLALMAASLLAAVSERIVLLGVLLALLVLTRADGLVFGLVLVAVATWGRAAKLVPLTLGGAAVLLPWVLYSLAVFGSPVPHTVVAKQTIVHAGDESLLRRAAEHVFWYVQGLGSAIGGGVFEALVLGALGCLIAFGAAACFERAGRPFLLPLALYLPALSVFYFVGRAPREFAWYLVPVTFCAMPLAAAGAFVLCKALRLWAEGQGVPSRLGTAFAALFLAAPLLNLPVGNRHALDQKARYQRIEDGLRRRVGEWLGENTPPDASVAMEAIGYQGTYSRRRVIDLAGLISPEVVRIRAEAATPSEAFRCVLEELQPDFLVLRSFEADRNESFFGGPLAETPEQRTAFARYREVMRFSAPAADAWMWEELAYLTILRRDGP